MGKEVTLSGSFGGSIKAWRRAARVTAQALGDMADSKGRTRKARGRWVENIEAGRSAGEVTRAECAAFDAALGLERGTAWAALLRDPRKVDPEVLAYFEALLQGDDREVR